MLRLAAAVLLEAHNERQTSDRRYVLRRLIVDRATVAAVARELGRSWDTVNAAALEAATTLLATNIARLDGVVVIGVDEHRWAHTRHAAGEGHMTVIVDLILYRAKNPAQGQ